MQRREIIAGIFSATLPLAARGQQPAPVIGFVNFADREGYAEPVAAFLKGLAETGFVEGRNVAIEWRWAKRQQNLLPGMVADLVSRQVVVFAATTTEAAFAAKASATTIPVIFEMAGDPVAFGLVKSLNRPGGNMTGVTQTNIDMDPKKLQLLHELVPGKRRIALLVDPAVASAPDEVKFATEAAQVLGVELLILHASREPELEEAFAKAKQSDAAGLLIGSGTLFTSHTPKLAALAVRHALPAMYKGRAFVSAGGLASYGTDIAEHYRLTGTYAGRILKGEKPADLPVLQASNVKLFINLTTAKALGVIVPPTLIARADEVIE